MPSKSQHHHKKHVMTPILLTCFAYFLFNISDSAVKAMAVKFHFSQLMLTGGVLTLLALGGHALATGGRKAFRTKKPGWMIVRGALSQVVALCNIAALPHITLAAFYTLAFTSPLWLALLAALFLKDRLGARRLGVIFFCFCVTLFIFRPGGAFFNMWAPLVLLGAFFYAAQMIVVRHIGPHESRPLMIMVGACMSILVSLPFLQAHWIWPNALEAGVFVMMTVIGISGLLCITYAVQMASSASLVAPYHYTQIVWGALIGYFAFGEVPKAETMAGAAAIISAGIYLIHHERRKSLLTPPPQS